MDIFQIEGDYLDSNVFVLVKDKDCIIIDAGANLDKVKKVVGSKKVCGILLTHGHYDHSLFALEYANKFNCNIFASKYIRDILSDGYANYSEGQYVVDDFSSFIYLEDGVVDIGQFKINAFKTMGHSKDSTCFVVDNILFAGDTLFVNGIGRIDLISSSKEDMIKTLNMLEGLDFDICYSGHGQPSDKQQQMKNISIYKKFLQR